MSATLLPSFVITFPSSSSSKLSLRHSPSPKICFSLDVENVKQERRTVASTTKNDIFISDLETILIKEDVPPPPPPPRPCTPLVTALKASAAKDIACFHFPGHNRGQAAPSSLTELIGTKPYHHDLTPLPELEGFVEDAQVQAARLFGSSATWFLVSGTTCGIQAAIMSTCSPGDYLILPRNAHISAISAMVLCGAIPKYIVPEYNSQWDIAGGMTPLQVENAIKELEMEGHRPAAVFVTSPTYNGICSDLGEIKKVCTSHGQIPLIVDNAHGAHFGFHRNLLPNSAILQGGDLVVQSTHKVLCSLSQSSMLHMSGNLVDKHKISRCLQLLQTTSPSYLLRASLDAARAQLEENPGRTFDEAVALAVETATLIKRIPYISLLEIKNFSKFRAADPLRITVGVWKLGLSGYEADNILCNELGIMAELIGTKSLTFLINLGTCREHVERLVSGLKHLSAAFAKNRRISINDGDCAPFADVNTGDEEDDSDCAPFGDINISLSPREAFFAKKKRVSMQESLGKICGELICPFPPGVAVLFPGEIITEHAMNYLLTVKEKGIVVSGASDPSLSTIVVVSRE